MRSARMSSWPPSKKSERASFNSWTRDPSRVALRKRLALACLLLGESHFGKHRLPVRRSPAGSRLTPSMASWPESSRTTRW